VNAEAELLQPDSYKGINALLRKGKIDVAFVCSGTYAAEPDAMDILAAPVVNGKTEYYGLIIVPANSPVQKFADLRGKSFLFVEEESNTGQWYPCRRACELVGKAGAFFGSTRFTGAHDLSILAIASNLADGAAVSSTVYDSMVAREPALKERVRVLERSAAFPSPPVVVRKSMPAGDRQRLLRVLVTLCDTDEGRDILHGMGCDRYVPARNEDYAGIERYTP
jgi:phosphonate transport system substrate-binding protein